MQVNELPPRMADPQYLPAMCAPIQRACRDFPTIAARHIGKCGLHIEEFNALQRKVRKNPIYRFMVQSEVEKLQKQYSQHQSSADQA